MLPAITRFGWQHGWPVGAAAILGIHWIYRSIFRLVGSRGCIPVISQTSQIWPISYYRALCGRTVDCLQRFVSGMVAILSAGRVGSGSYLEHV